MNAELLEQRKPVWSALSEFYLDTELDEEEIKRIAQVVREAGLTFVQAQEINVREVAPVVMTNLYSIIGVWNGFDEEWLFDAITKKLRKGVPTLFFSESLWRYWVERYTNHYLEKLKLYL